MKHFTPLLVFFWLTVNLSVFGQVQMERILSVSWGENPDQIGMHRAAPDMLPRGPFLGPGGYCIGPEGLVWISDSVQGFIKAFEVKQNNAKRIHAFACPFQRLGDIKVSKEKIFVCTMSPPGIAVLAKRTGKVEKHISIPLRSPRRILVVRDNLFAIEDGEEGPWIVREDAVSRHPAQALEAVGDARKLYGTLYDFDPFSRKLLHAGWSGQINEPELFSIFRTPKQTISFSRLLGLYENHPILIVQTASEPMLIQLFSYDAQGIVVKSAKFPVQGSIYLPSQWIVGPNGKVYSCEADLKGFQIYELNF